MKFKSKARPREAGRGRFDPDPTPQLKNLDPAVNNNKIRIRPWDNIRIRIWTMVIISNLEGFNHVLYVHEVVTHFI